MRHGVLSDSHPLALRPSRGCNNPPLRRGATAPSDSHRPLPGHARTPATPSTGPARFFLGRRLCLSDRDLVAPSAAPLALVLAPRTRVQAHHTRLEPLCTAPNRTTRRSRPLSRHARTTPTRKFNDRSRPLGQGERQTSLPTAAAAPPPSGQPKGQGDRRKAAKGPRKAHPAVGRAPDPDPPRLVLARPRRPLGRGTPASVSARP